jgi:hypothetical protein
MTHIQLPKEGIRNLTHQCRDGTFVPGNFEKLEKINFFYKSDCFLLQHFCPYVSVFS